ncbi:MAG: FIST C-terminal domain-containing protein [Pseudomonadota bacterium]
MYLPADNIDRMATTIATHADPSKVTAVFVGANHAEDVVALQIALRNAGIPFFGCVFPGLVVGGEVKTDGVLVQTLTMPHPPRVVSLEAEDAIDLPLLPDGVATGLILYQANSATAGGLLEQMYHAYSDALNLIGGAGSNPLGGGAPALFDNDGTYNNAAIVGLLSNHCDIRIKHGFERERGPFIATRTTPNVIEELNWEPAQSVYTQALRDCGIEGLDPEHLIERAKQFPFGISCDGAEDVVRTPIELGDGVIRCQGNVPEHSVVHVLYATPERLIDASQGLFSGVKPASADRCFVFLCRSRETVLGERFHEELSIVSAGANRAVGNGQVAGVLAQGEIGSPGSTFPQLRNKTIVVGLLSSPS